MDLVKRLAQGTEKLVDTLEPHVDSLIQLGWPISVWLSILFLSFSFVTSCITSYPLRAIVTCIAVNLLVAYCCYVGYSLVARHLHKRATAADDVDVFGVKRTRQAASVDEQRVSRTDVTPLRRVKREGWLTVRRAELDASFNPGSVPGVATSASSLHQQQDTSTTASDSASIHSTASSTTAASMLGGLTGWGTQAKGWMDGYTERQSSAKAKKKALTEQRVWAALSDTQLSLYEDMDKSVLLYLIKVPMYSISIESAEEAPLQAGSTAISSASSKSKMLDGELFVKKTVIALRLKPENGGPLPTAYASSTSLPAPAAGDISTSSPVSPGPAHLETPCLAFHRLPASSSSNSAPGGSGGGATDIPEHGGIQPFLLSVKVQPDKEDWYHDLVLSTKLRDEDKCARDDKLFRPEDMERFLDGLDETPELSQSRVLNAFIATMYFRNYRE